MPLFVLLMLFGTLAVIGGVFILGPPKVRRQRVVAAQLKARVQISMLTRRALRDLRVAQQNSRVRADRMIRTTDDWRPLS